MGLSLWFLVSFRTTGSEGVPLPEGGGHGLLVDYATAGLQSPEKPPLLHW